MGIVQRDSFRVTVISYAGAIIGYLNKIFLFTNFLDTDQVGLANIMVTISLIYAQVAALGARNIITRFFPFFNDEKNGHHGFLFAVITLGFSGFTIATLLFLLLRQPFAMLYQDTSPLLVEYAAYLIPMGLAILFFNIFESYLRCVYRNIIPTLAHEVILRLLVTISISLYALNAISFPVFVAVYVAAYCMPAFFLIIYSGLKGLLQLKPQWTPLLKRLSKIMVVYGLYLLLNNLSGFLLISIDSLMVAGMIDLGAAGIYTTMVFMTSVMLIPYRSMAKVTGPLIAQFWKTRAYGQMHDTYKKATAANMVVGAALFMLLWVNLDAIFLFMQPEYTAGRYVFLLLGVGKLFDMSAGLNATILITSKKYRYDLLFTMSMAVFTFFTNLVCIPLWGIEGAAFASMLSLVVFNVLRISFIYHHYHIQPFIAKQVWVPLIMASIMLLSTQIGLMYFVLADILLRSAAAATLFIIPMWLLNISPELNQWATKQIVMVLNRWRK